MTFLAREYIKRIKECNDELNVFLVVNEKAQPECDGPLAGMPIAIKDNIVTKDLETTAASNILKGYIPPYDATVVTRLKNAGAIIIGKTNLDAFAHGGSTETSDFGVTRNPLDTKRIPGGSSGGSAAAVAADLCVAALGSGTGGSIRQPASLCGLVGLRPTYGRVSRYGLIAMGSSVDAIGPLTRTVEDAALLLEVVAGRDEKDATTSEQPVGAYVDACKNANIENLKIGIAPELFPDKVDPEVAQLVRNKIGELEQAGAEVVDISLPYAKYASAVYAILISSELSTNLARHDGVRYGYSSAESDNIYEFFAKSRAQGFGDEAKRRIMTGTFALSAGYYDACYRKASQVRTLIRKDFEKAFSQVDVIISPTVPSVAQKIGKAADDPIFGYVTDELLNPSAVSGLPAISVPVGLALVPDDPSKKLPAGMQIIGRQFDEETIFRVASCSYQP